MFDKREGNECLESFKYWPFPEGAWSSCVMGSGVLRDKLTATTYMPASVATFRTYLLPSSIQSGSSSLQKPEPSLLETSRVRLPSTSAGTY